MAGEDEMKIRDIHAGLLVCKREGSFWGEIVDTCQHGNVIVLSYFDDCHHYINLKRLIEPSKSKRVGYVIEPDGEQFHAYIPFFKGCHTTGDTKEEAYSNLKDAIHVYIRAMRKHGEVNLCKGKWDNWFFKVEPLQEEQC